MAVHGLGQAGGVVDHRAGDHGQRGVVGERSPGADEGGDRVATGEGVRHGPAAQAAVRARDQQAHGRLRRSAFGMRTGSRRKARFGQENHSGTRGTSVNSVDNPDQSFPGRRGR
ncbi:hypothetical protein GCM10010428_33000 [Actinosynnema pretiosum subsp. pretiosum]